MIIRKYIGANNQEAIQKVKNDIGSDALIISTKRVRQKGFLGMFKRKFTEVTAAIDEVEAKKKKAIVAKKQASNLTAASQNVIFQQFQNSLNGGGGGVSGGAGVGVGVGGVGGRGGGSIGVGGVSGVGGRGGGNVRGGGTQPSLHLADVYNTGVQLPLQLDNPYNGGTRPNAPARGGANGDGVYANGAYSNGAYSDGAYVDGTRRQRAQMPDNAYNGGLRQPMQMPDGANVIDARHPMQTSGGAYVIGARQPAQSPYAPDFDDDDDYDYYDDYEESENYNAGRMTNLEDKINSLEDIVNKVYGVVSSSVQSVYENEAAETTVPLTKVLRLFYNNLIKNEVEPRFSKKIIEKVSVQLCDDGNSNDAASALYNEIFASLGQPETINIREDKKPTVAILIGPTGVGKTTTLAKIAANYSLDKNLKVGLITADTYRIAAVEQLKTYAEILGLPLSVIYTPQEMKKAIEEYQNKDLILIDTAGRNYKNKLQFDELKDLISEAEADEIFLVLSSTTSVRNNREIINNYEFLDEFKLIFTKTDETPTLGMLLNARLMTGKSLSYITIGQSVPDDIEVASIEKITRNLIGSATE